MYESVTGRSGPVALPAGPPRDGSRGSRMHYEPDALPPPSGVRERVTMPGVFLAVIGGINLLAASLMLFRGYQVSKMTPADFDKLMEQLPAEPRQKFREDMKEAGMTTDQLLSVMTRACF